MAKVTRIDWAINTGESWWSGTDTQIKIEIYRDNQLLKRLNLEPGRTPRLDRGEFATYFWVFQNPDGLGVAGPEPQFLTMKNSRMGFRGI